MTTEYWIDPLCGIIHTKKPECGELKKNFKHVITVSEVVSKITAEYRHSVELYEMRPDSLAGLHAAGRAQCASYLLDMWAPDAERNNKMASIWRDVLARGEAGR